MNKDLVIELIKMIGNKSEQNNDFWKVGEKYFIRTVTYHSVGELVSIDDKELVLKNASWIADSGRFNEALKSGTLDEIEPFLDDVLINRNSIVDATNWNHDLPRCVK